MPYSHLIPIPTANSSSSAIIKTLPSAPPSSTNTASSSAKPPPNSTPKTAYAASFATQPPQAASRPAGFITTTPRPSHKKTVLPTTATPATASSCCATPTYHINEQTARCDWFDAQGELAYYDWFVHDPAIGENIYAGTYPPNETEHLPENQIQPYLPVYSD